MAQKRVNGMINSNGKPAAGDKFYSSIQSSNPYTVAVTFKEVFDASTTPIGPGLGVGQRQGRPGDLATDLEHQPGDSDRLLDRGSAVFQRHHPGPRLLHQELNALTARDLRPLPATRRRPAAIAVPVAGREPPRGSPCLPRASLRRSRAR